jgi:hypothetical protein
LFRPGGKNTLLSPARNGPESSGKQLLEHSGLSLLLALGQALGQTQGQAFGAPLFNSHTLNAGNIGHIVILNALNILADLSFQILGQ